MRGKVHWKWVLCLVLHAGGWATGRAADASAGRLSGATNIIDQALHLPPGFRLETVWRAERTNQSPWRCLAEGQSGQWWLAPSNDSGGLLRLTMSATGSVTRVDVVPTPLKRFTGLACAWGNLYAAAEGPSGAGVYRLAKSEEEDGFGPSDTSLLLALGTKEGSGCRGLAVGSDRRLYVACGGLDFTPADLSSNSPWRQTGSGRLAPNCAGAGNTENRLATPSGCILRTDPEGKHWMVVLGGLHDPWDLAVGEDGEAFVADRETAAQRGLPWHRPAQLFHCISGGDAGWRPGGAAWPEWFPDALPPVAALGLATPAGLASGGRTHFPEPYRQALFIGDPSRNRLLAVRLTREGAGFRGQVEPVIQTELLDLAALATGTDGSLYLLTGARQGPSGLLRLRYGDGEETTEADATPAVDDRQAEARQLRRRMEARLEQAREMGRDGESGPLISTDPTLQYLARQDWEARTNVAWAKRVRAATDAAEVDAVLLAWARAAQPLNSAEFVDAWCRFFQSSPTADRGFGAFRSLAWALWRSGPPAPAERQALLDLLDPLYPAPSERSNVLLAELLVFLEAPAIVPRTLALLEATPVMEEQVRLLCQLSLCQTGWTTGHRREFFRWLDRIEAGGTVSSRLRAWFEEAALPCVPGKDLAALLASLRSAASAQLNDGERRELAGVISPQAVVFVPSNLQGRKATAWRMEDFEALLRDRRSGSAVERGGAAFDMGQCRTCHRFGREGGSVGPDLTAVAQRLSRREMLESILLPSKQIVERYRIVRLALKEGDEIVGRLLEETPDRLHVLTNPLSGASQWFRRAEVSDLTFSAVSPMPEGLAAFLTQEEILDLIAFLESGQNASAADSRP